MRKKGSEFEFKAERDRAICLAYRQALRAVESIYMPEVMSAVVRQPCERFYVSEERAAIVVSSMMRDPSSISGMRGERQRMFGEIYRRVMELRAQRPRRSLASMIREVVNSPAPEFYISPRYAQNLISKTKNR